MTDRAELDRLRKMKRLRELESRAGGQQAQAVSAPQEQSTPMSHRIGAGLGGALKGATLGASDHIEAGLSSLIPIDRMVAPDGSADIRFGQYKDNLEQIRQRNEKQREAAPITYAGGQIGGSVVGVGKLAKVGALPSAMIKGKGLKATTLGLGLDGAAIAGVDALLNGRENAGGEALTGGAIGAGLNIATRGAGSALAPLFRGKKPAVPSTQNLLDNASRTRKEITDLGVQYSPEQLKQLALGVTDDIPVSGIDAATGKIGKLAKRITKNTDEPATFEQLDNLRKQIDLPVTASNSDKRLAGVLRSNIDDFVQKIDPQTGAKEGLDSLLNASRDYTRRGRTAEALEQAIEAAKTRTAKSGTGGNLDNNLRSEVDKVLKKQGKFMPKELKSKLEGVSRGSKGQNLARLIGRGLSPTTGALNMFATGAATVGTSGANIPFQLAGMGLKRGSEKTTQKSIENIIREIQAGSKQAAARPDTRLSKAMADKKRQEEIARIFATATIAGN